MFPMRTVKNLLIDYNFSLEHLPQNTIGALYEKISYLDDLIDLAIREKEEKHDDLRLYYSTLEYQKMIVDFQKDREVALRELQNLGVDYYKMKAESEAQFERRLKAMLGGE